jgi:hypothetical protein
MYLATHAGAGTSGDFKIELATAGTVFIVDVPGLGRATIDLEAAIEAAIETLRKLS